MPAVPPTIDSPPAAPVRGDKATFSSRFEAFLSWFIGSFYPWITSIAANLFANATEAQASASSAAAAAAASGVTASLWVTGTTYAVGDVRWSPLTYQSYRRKTVGAGATDPSLDPTNWAALVAPVPDFVYQSMGVM